MESVQCISVANSKVCITKISEPRRPQWSNMKRQDCYCHLTLLLLLQAGSRRGSQRAMLRTYARLKLSWTDTQMDRHCATIRASLACASRANYK